MDRAAEGPNAGPGKSSSANATANEGSQQPGGGQQQRTAAPLERQEAEGEESPLAATTAGAHREVEEDDELGPENVMAGNNAEDPSEFPEGHRDVLETWQAGVGGSEPVTGLGDDATEEEDIYTGLAGGGAHGLAAQVDRSTLDQFAAEHQFIGPEDQVVMANQGAVVDERAISRSARDGVYGGEREDVMGGFSTERDEGPTVEESFAEYVHPDEHGGLFGSKTAEELEDEQWARERGILSGSAATADPGFHGFETRGNEQDDEANSVGFYGF